jgi:mono/diheme cytochrome c family protein
VNRGRKNFFFEKKNQKTSNWLTPSFGERVAQTIEKSFASFLQKRSPSLIAFFLLATTASATAQSPPYPQIERGRYLATVGDCVACHTAPDGVDFAGGLGMKTPFGTIYSANLTPDPKTGLGGWTADDLWKALHDGHDRTGSNLYPAMPYAWTSLATRADSDDIFAFLQTLAPVERTRPANDLIPPLGLRFSIDGWNALFFRPGTFKPDPSHNAEWNRGAYLVTGLGHCGACHTKLDMLGAPESSRALEGNTLDGWYAPDITNAAATGLGGWQRADITAYLQTGRNARAIAAGPMAEVVMRSTQFMTPDDLGAIAAYLKSQPGAAAPAAPAVDSKLHSAGQAIYADNCAGCHGAQGKGEAELIPSLSGNGVVMGREPSGILHVILQGAVANHTRQAPTDPGMPAFSWKLGDAQIAAVASYIRSSWGNQASAVAPSAVGDMRHRLYESTPK